MRGIEGFFTEDEGRWYARLARSLKGGTFVEIGSWKGRSTSFVGPVCNANGTRLVCVDHWSGSFDSLRETYEAKLATEDVEATFRANMKELGIEVEVIRRPSLEAATTFEDASVDRIFLDGSHDGPSVAADLEAWFPKLAPNGVFAGHDYDHKHADLCASVDAFAAKNGLIVKRGPRSTWLYERASLI
ncbi:MAG TPA: class I SAM-dependent methyltransferase [Polyangiaceae bacterium]